MYNEGKAILRDLAKQGKAELIVELTAFPDDPRFSDDPPSCVVTITSKDRHDPENAAKTTIKEISRTTDRSDRTFRVSAETTVGAFNRWIRRRKPSSLEITITVEPTNGWNEYYEPTNKVVTVAAGESRSITVSLRPKDSRSSRRIILEKPNPLTRAPKGDGEPPAQHLS